MSNTNPEKSYEETTLFDMPCKCGSGLMIGQCCSSHHPCPCGSGFLAGDCCYSVDFDEEYDLIDN